MSVTYVLIQLPTILSILSFQPTMGTTPLGSRPFHFLSPSEDQTEQRFAINLAVGGVLGT